MAAAVVLLEIANGAGPTFTNADSGASGTPPKFNREDTVAGTTPVPIPTSAGTNYSWLKWLCLYVATAGTTQISNRRVQLSATPSAGLGLFFQGQATYASATSANMPAAATANGPATPAGFTIASTATQVYDSASASSTATGRNGNYCEMCAGVDNGNYTGGAGNAVPMPDIRLIYDEA